MIPTQPGRYTSPGVDLPAVATATIFLHGRGVQPRARWAVLVCALAEHGFQPGQELSLNILQSASGSNLPPLQVTADAAQIIVTRYLSGADLGALHLSTGATVTLTPANWKLKVYADW